MNDKEDEQEGPRGKKSCSPSASVRAVSSYEYVAGERRNLGEIALTTINQTSIVRVESILSIGRSLEVNGRASS